MKYLKFYRNIFFVFFLTSCNGLGDKEVVGKYHLVAVDYEPSQTILGYDSVGDQSFEPVVAAMVYAVGFDRNFIIVKQHPFRYLSGPPDMNATAYFIVGQINGGLHNANWKGVYGPFNEPQFSAKRKELNVPDSVDFSIFVK